ncbi:MAG TPA: isoprenylcysteine carboxylmethyltransferase family protein [Anaerolineales bacterium]|nr:isoprenylcysteine carboxylmethyltransferase family protein [Anaerolineales bacterium]
MNTKNDHAQVVINPFLIYIAFGFCAALLQRFVPLPFIGQLSASLIGVTVMIISFFFGLPAVINMLAAKTTPNPNRPTTVLIFSGPYRFSRNPMYIGLTLLYAGLMMYLQLPWGLIFLPVVIWLITIWVILPEEKYLGQKFGTEYLNYKSTVRRWI